MTFWEDAITEFGQLEEYAKTRKEELSKIFKDEISYFERCQKLLIEVVLILGKNKHRTIADKSIRDLLADAFDFLRAAVGLTIQGYPSLAFPLMRRAFESISLISYFTLKPQRAESWDDGKEIPSSEVRKFLHSHPMGEREDATKEMYRFFSSGTHPNREYVPGRFLGEGNEFTLGAIGMPDLLVVAEHVRRLMNLWFWLTAITSFRYKEIIDFIDRSYGERYLSIQGEAEKLLESLIKEMNLLFKETPLKETL